MSGAFDSLRKQALMRRADSADSPGKYLSPFGNEMTQELSVFEIDIGDFFSAELADSFAPNTEPSWTWHSVCPFYRIGPGMTASVPVANFYISKSIGGASGSAISEGAKSCLGAFLRLAALILSERLRSSSMRTEINRMM